MNLKIYATMKREHLGKLMMLSFLFTGFVLQGQTLTLDNATPIKSTTTGTNNDVGNSVAYDAQGNYYVVGTLNGSADFDPLTAGTQGPGSILNNGQAFLAKYDSSGAYQWYRLLSGGIGSYAGQVTTSANGVFVSHLYDAGGSNYLVRLTKYDFDGNLIWNNTLLTNTIATTANRVNSLKTDASGNIYVAGIFVDTADFDPSGSTAYLSGTGGSSPSGYIAKYDGSSGAYQWAFRIAGNTSTDGTNYGTGMLNFKMAISGNSLFVTGRFVGSNIDFDPSSSGVNTLSMNGSTLAPIFIAKYDLSQQPSSTSFFQWVFQPQGAFTSRSSSYSARFSMPSDIDVDASGRIYTVGQYILSSGAADFDPGAGTTPDMTTGTEMKLYVASYDGSLTPTDSGFYRWAFTRSGSSSNITTASAPLYNSNYISAIACDSSGDFYLGGSFRGANVDMNPLCSASPVLISGSSVDIYLAKYSNTGICLWANSFATTSDGLSNGIASLATGGGKIYATGMYKSSAGIDFDPTLGTTSVTSYSTGSDVIVLKYSEVSGTPILDPIVHPTCSVSTGTITISNYNPSYTYSVSPSAGVSISGDTITAPAGTYTVTATFGSCLPAIPILSLTSSSVTLDAQVNTWNGTVWSSGVEPTSSQKAVFEGDFSSITDIVCCSCQVNSGVVVFNSGDTLKVTNEVTVVGGSLTFEDDASLVQTNDASVNSGSITYKRAVTSLNGYDYVYWSSPVENQALAGLYSVPNPGSKYEWHPIVLNPNNAHGNWIAPTTTDMTVGKGYIIRASSSSGWTGSLTSQFVGVPNNGIFNLTLQRIADSGLINDRWNLIGNPYPSSVNAIDFLTTNTHLDGYVYLWQHANAPNNTAAQPYYQSFVYNYSNDYLVYNKLGPQSQDGFDGYIASGQGFFVNLLQGSTATADVTFNNAMRSEAYDNSQFFRTAEETQDEDENRSRIWLDLVDVNNIPARTLLGYAAGATMARDRMYDAETNSTQNNIYTLINEDKYAIQGRHPFVITDQVPLGYNATVSGEFKIAIAGVDGIFDTQDIYLLDTANDTIHDLKLSPYSFNTAAGVFNNRFKIVYTTAALGINQPENSLNDVKILTAHHELEIISTSVAISGIEIYDVLGKLLFAESNIQSQSFQTQSLGLVQQVLFVRITLINGFSVVKKVLIK